MRNVILRTAHRALARALYLSFDMPSIVRYGRRHKVKPQRKETPMDAREKLAAFNHKQSTDTLVAAMLDLHPRQHDAPENGIAIRSIYNELEQRYPVADRLMAAWFEDESPEGIEFITSHGYAELMALAVSEAQRLANPVGATD